MSKVILAEYAAAHRALKLPKPLEGVQDRQRVKIAIAEAADKAEPQWKRHRGIFDGDAGRQIAAAIREAFGREEIEV